MLKGTRSRHSENVAIWPANLFVLFLNGCFLFWLLLKPGSHDLFVTIDILTPVFMPVVVLLFCAYTALRYRADIARASRGQKWAVCCFCLYPFLYGLSSIYWAYSLLVLKQPVPSPSLADVTWLLAYPSLLSGILLLPRQSMPFRARVRTVVDSFMILVSVVAFSWYFILGPTLLQSGGSFLTQVVETAYPFFDLVLFACLLLLAFHNVERILRPTVMLLSLSLLVIMVGDCIYDIEVLRGTYVAGEVLDATWVLGLSLVGLAALSLQHTFLKGEGTEASSSPALSVGLPSMWRALLPYSLVPLVALLVIFLLGSISGQAFLKTGVYVSTAILIVLILVRQFLVVRESVRYAHMARQLNDELQTAYQTLSEKNEALHHANAQLEALATTDPLTGLSNHRALVQELDQELERAQRYPHSSSLLFFDIDHFKALNDGYGHAAGDAILREFGLLVQSIVRNIDIVGRWGGEEFIAILPQIEVQEAQTVAERIRANVAEHTFSVGAGMRLTCSLGGASYPADAQERDSLIEAADRAMYAAKHLGRNQVRMAHDTAILLDGEEKRLGSREDAALTGTVDAICLLMEERDPFVAMYTRQVAHLSIRVGLEMGLDASEAYMLGLAGRLHDIGKVGIPDVILRKSGQLTVQEWHLMHQHPAIGATIISHIPSLRAIASIIRSHHEHFDGTGYPDQLTASEIPLGARILAVVNAFTSLTSDLPYQEARSRNWALAELLRGAGTRFDPQIVTTFVHLMEIEQKIARGQMVGVD